MCSTFRRAILFGTSLAVLSQSYVLAAAPKYSTATEQQSAAKSSVTEAKTNSKAPLFDDEGNQQTKGHMLVQVVDTAGRPLPATKIHSSIWTHDKGFKANRDYKTDENGKVEIKLPSSLYILRLWASRHAYVEQFIHWENQPPNERKLVPEELTIRLQAGTVIGGIVVDENDKPIPNAVVEVHSRPGRSLASGKDLKTDAAGRWKLENVPPGDDFEIRAIATHPNFVSLHSYYDLGLQKPLSMKQLRAQSAKIVLQRGVHLTGKITDPMGKPVAGALVIWGDRPYWEHKPQQEVHSDSQGIYHLPPLPPGPMRITIVAKGWMPEMRQVSITPEMPALDFQLKAGKKLRIRVVDADDKPVPQTYFHIEDWRGAMSLYNDSHPNVLNSKIPTNSDKNGIFEWSWAPDDAVKFRVSAIGNYATPEIEFTANDREQVFKLLPLLRISGKVIDAVTKKPVEEFSIIPVIEFNPKLAVVERQDEVRRSAGNYVIEKLDRTDCAYRLRVEADGYRAAVSKSFRVGDRNAVADFQLQPAPAVSGRVLDPNGKPASGVEVYLATKTQLVQDLWAAGDASRSDLRVFTNKNGEFKFRPQYERYIVIAKSDAGYAESDLRPDQTPGDMKLKKWARVDGRLMQAGKPVPGAQVYLNSLRPRFGDWPDIDDGLTATTDDNGRFAFQRVPPVKCVVAARLSPWKAFPITSSQHTPLDLQPGQHVTLNLGGDGTQVIGQVKLVGEKASDFDLHWSLNHLLRKAPGIEPPIGLRGPDFDWKRGWNDAWSTNLEGLAFLDTLHTYFVVLGSDGALSISGVPAGDYELALKIYEHKDPNACLVNPVGSKIVRFKVSDSDVASGTLNLGSITIDAALGPQPGEMVSDFEFETLDGSKESLSKFRGQFVAVDFWATWCTSCVESLPQLREVHGTHGKSGRLSVLSINVDADNAAAQSFLKAHPLPWTQGLLEDGLESQVLTRSGVSSIPTYMLIGPDGKLIDKYYSVEKLKEKFDAIRQTLDSKK
jgi:uncharacterized GH25 family protein/thiol-disulfide isomerase/thioredoxin